MVIEMNPRVSRSSALASKATGFPIAKIAARLAVGYALEEIDNDITRLTPASFEPTIDYVVVKWPRFAFEKFSGVDERLSTHMKSVGEVDGDRPHVPAGLREGDAQPRARRDPARSTARWRSCSTRLEMPGPRPLRRPARGLPRGRRRPRRSSGARRSTCGSCASCARSPPTPRRRSPATRTLQGRRHLRGRVRRRDAVLLLGLGALRGRGRRRAPRGPPRRQAERRHPRRRARTASARGSSSTTAACTPR